MKFQALREKNQPDNPLMIPENLQEEYTLKVPMYAIPPDVFNTLVEMMAEIAKRQAPMQDKIGELPTWTDWRQDIQPEVEQAMNSHTRAVQSCENNLLRRFQSLPATVTESLKGKISELEQTLQARDNTPKKRRWQWMGIGAASLLILQGLLLLSKILFW